MLALSKCIKETTLYYENLPLAKPQYGFFAKKNMEGDIWEFN